MARNRTKADTRMAFIAALTATDQLTDADRHIVAVETREDARKHASRVRFETQLAFHEASAAAVRLTIAWHEHKPNHPATAEAEFIHTARAVALIDRIGAYVALPARTKGGVKDKARMIDKWQRGVSGNTIAVQHWRDAHKEWAETIQAEAQALGFSMNMEG